MATEAEVHSGRKIPKGLRLKKISIESGHQVKDEVIYVRMTDSDVRQIDQMCKKFEVKFRSEMIRILVLKAIENIKE